MIDKDARAEHSLRLQLHGFTPEDGAARINAPTSRSQSHLERMKQRHRRGVH